MEQELKITIGGEAGQGIETIGYSLLKILARAGYHVFSTQDYQSLIRGGHNFFKIRVAERLIRAMREGTHILVALNAETVDLHKEEVEEGGLIVFDQDKISICEDKTVCAGISLEKMARESGSKLYTNSVALGSTLGIIGLDFNLLSDSLEEIFTPKGREVVEANQVAAKKGYEYARETYGHHPKLQLKRKKAVERMVINGNEAIALGAIASGLQFYTAYPMTPSTGIMTYLAGEAEQFGYLVEQAEDEIAAINMALGASFAGARAMTASSGGGFALMVEGLSLAGMTETPLVIGLLQRPGPATGLPTRSEQADLLFALYTAHGEFPRAILAPGSVEDCFYLTVKAFNLADKYQSPVIILSDQYLADSYADVSPFDLSTIKIERDILKRGEEGYKRHKLTESGISPRAVPGTEGIVVVTDSDEHDEEGHIIEDGATRRIMVEKRLRKLEGLQREVEPLVIYGKENPDLLLLGWGSTRGVLQEVIDILNSQDKRAGLVHLNQVWPLAHNLCFLLAPARKVVAVENNATGQLCRLVAQETGTIIEQKILKYDGRPFTPEYILERL